MLVKVNLLYVIDLKVDGPAINKLFLVGKNNLLISLDEVQ